jgi:hypothetical protein
MTKISQELAWFSLSCKQDEPFCRMGDDEAVKSSLDHPQTLYLYFRKKYHDMERECQVGVGSYRVKILFGHCLIGS